MADVTWRLSVMGHELAQQSREAIRSTAEKIRLSRLIIDQDTRKL
jgi:hypothetical protein